MPEKDCDELEVEFQTVIAKLEKMREDYEVVRWMKVEHKRLIKLAKTAAHLTDADEFDDASWDSYEHSIFRNAYPPEGPKAMKLYDELRRIHAEMVKACAPETAARIAAAKAAQADAKAKAKANRAAAAKSRKNRNKANLLAAAAKIAADEAAGIGRPKRHAKKPTRKNSN
jgi:hypothetical protein